VPLRHAYFFGSFGNRIHYLAIGINALQAHVMLDDCDEIRDAAKIMILDALITLKYQTQ